MNVFTKTMTYKNALMIDRSICKTLKNLNIYNEPVLIYVRTKSDAFVYFTDEKMTHCIGKGGYGTMLYIISNDKLICISHLSKNITDILNSLAENSCNVDNLPSIIDKLSNHLKLCVNFIRTEIPNLDIIEHTKSANSI